MKISRSENATFVWKSQLITMGDAVPGRLTQTLSDIDENEIYDITISFGMKEK